MCQISMDNVVGDIPNKTSHWPGLQAGESRDLTTDKDITQGVRALASHFTGQHRIQIQLQNSWEQGEQDEGLSTSFHGSCE